MAVAEKTPAVRDGAGTTYLVTMAHYGLRMRVEQALKPLGVTGLQFSILSAVARNERLSSAKLSRYFYVSPQNMGQLLAGLESRGLIRRDEDVENRRILLISMTETGRTLLAQGEAAMAALEADVFRDFSGEEIQTLRAMLKRVAKSVRG